MRHSDFELIYMERNAFAFLKAWPDVPEVLKPVYQRLYDARIIATPPNEATGPGSAWRSGASLTYLGNLLLQAIKAQTFSYFTIPQALGVWGDLLPMKRPDMVAYLKLFQLDYDHPDVKSYLAAGVKPRRDTFAGFVTTIDVDTEQLMSELGGARDRAGIGSLLKAFASLESTLRKATEARTWAT